MKKAIITGITGQDGAYLAKFLLEKGYSLRNNSPSFFDEFVAHSGPRNREASKLRID